MTERQKYSGRKFERNERGSTLVLVTLFIFVLFGFTAISIDVANVYREKHKAHDATDAAALAGVAKLDPSGTAASAITEADVIANTNGVTDVEIAAAPTTTNGCVACAAQIQVGLWDGVNFTANATPYNAVRVPAQRTVPLNFGRVVGFSQMTPAVNSIAAIGVQTVPYGVPDNVLGPVGSTITLQRWNPGNWGVLDLCGPVGGNNVVAVITGGGCFASVGDTTGTRTGVPNKTANGFADLFNSGQTVIVLPVTSAFPNGSSGNVTVENFIAVQLLNAGSGSGANWNLNVQILGVGFDDLKRLGLGPVRSLVE